MWQYFLWNEPLNVIKDENINTKIISLLIMFLNLVGEVSQEVYWVRNKEKEGPMNP